MPSEGTSWLFNGTGPGPGTAPSPACLRALSRRPALRAPLPGTEFTSTLPLGLPRPHPGLGAAPEPHSPSAGVGAHAHAHARAHTCSQTNVGGLGRVVRPRALKGDLAAGGDRGGGTGWLQGSARSVGPLGKTSQSCYPHAHCHHCFGTTIGVQCQRGSYQRPREGDSRRTLPRRTLPRRGPWLRAPAPPPRQGFPF